VAWESLKHTESIDFVRPMRHPRMLRDLDVLVGRELNHAAGRKCLELGCCAGLFMRFMEMRHGFQVHGIDDVPPGGRNESSESSSGGDRCPHGKCSDVFEYPSRETFDILMSIGPI
jgi:cyclopropane fatty-acyl-phospholipid synthase-like methyltransferase